jgi:hypothetical protein
MAIQSTKQLVEARIPVTNDIIGKLDAVAINLAIEETKAIHDFGDDKDLSPKEMIYIADLTATTLLQRSLDRYKEDSKSKVIQDQLVDEYQDKLKYIKELIAQYQANAKKLAVKLGLSSSTSAPPPIVIKVGAAAETGT